MIAKGTLVLVAAAVLLPQPCTSRRRQRRRAAAASDAIDSDDQRPLTPVKSNAGRFAVKRHQSWRQISLEHFHVTTKRSIKFSFAGESLAYVTPWNSHGYDVAKALAERFDYIAPVWFQIRESEQGLATITGLHDIDRGWIKAVRAPCASTSRAGSRRAGTPPSKCPKVVPRFVWEARALSETEQARAVTLIVDVIVSNSLDGLVLEAPVSRPMLLWLVTLKQALEVATETTRTRKGLAPLELVLVLPPTVKDESGQVLQGLNHEGLKEAAKIADRFSLMTYDYSSGKGVVGPNAPLAWMEESVEALLGPAGDSDGLEDEDEDGAVQVSADGSLARGTGGASSGRRALARKLLLGLNMYGTDNGQPITGSKYLELLREHKPRIVLDNDAEEHYFEYMDAASRQRHQVWYPTLYSIRKRHQLAQELGVGVAMWEVGQGLDFFYDLY